MLFKKDKIKESLKKLNGLNIGYIYSSYLDPDRNRLFLVVDGIEGYELREYDLNSVSLLNSSSINYPEITFLTTPSLNKNGISVIRSYHGEEYEELVYDINNSKVLIEPGLYDSFAFYSSEVSPATGRDVIDYTKDFNAIIGVFDIVSRDEDDIYTYNDPLTGTNVTCDFGIHEGIYYAMINMDGTIRSNKLFRGNDFSKIEFIVDMDEFKSLEAYKVYRQDVVNRRKQNLKKDFNKSMQKYGAYFPYQNEGVIKLLK